MTREVSRPLLVAKYKVSSRASFPLFLGPEMVALGGIGDYSYRGSIKEFPHPLADIGGRVHLITLTVEREMDALVVFRI